MAPIKIMNVNFDFMVLGSTGIHQGQQTTLASLSALDSGSPIPAVSVKPVGISDERISSYGVKPYHPQRSVKVVGAACHD